MDSPTGAAGRNLGLFIAVRPYKQTRPADQAMDN